MANVEAVEKFQKLATLALSEDDDGESTEEARNAAVRAIEMLSDEDGDLIVIPKAELEGLKRRVDGSEGALARVKDAQQKGLLMGGLLGWMIGKSRGF